MEPEGRYFIQTTRYREMWRIIPRSERIFVDGGCLVVYDEDDHVIIAYAPGEWVECIDAQVFEELNPSTPLE
jgi:hypothetical protein